jgi:hypothetical protein
VVPLAQAYLLADSWYRDRLDPTWRRRTVTETEALFVSLGLDSEFWQLSAKR